jgi:tetratricopeptide (TPR) repeat protein
MKIISLLLILLISFANFAQDKDNYLPQGNKDFAAKNYNEAEANYRISASKSPKKAIASYNLGNTIYSINKPQEAGLAYVKAIVNSKNRPEKHNAFHNLGNVFMKSKDYANAVQAYKNALINNPADDESRYNYALAKKMLKDNPPKKDDKKDKDKKDKDKKDKEKKDKDKKDKEKQDQDKKEGDNKDKNDEQKPNGKSKPQEGGISKDRVKNLLEAVNNEEKKIQEKVNKNKVKGNPIKTEKDW